MRSLAIIAVFACATLAGACQSIPKDQTVAEYCAVEDHANKDVCKINVEIDGQKRALADTNLTLSQARAVADEALAAANRAEATANAALAREDAIHCETRTLSKTNVGSCSPGYKLVSCTQTRFTTRAGGTSIMRSIDDSQCRFQDRVLEMQVRCCMAGAAPAPTEPVPMTTPTRRVRSSPAGS